MKETSSIGQKAVGFWYILALLGMISILVAINITKESPKQETETTTYENISKSWTLDKEGTMPADVSKLGEYIDEKTGVLSLYYQLPKMDADTSLVYRSKDVYTKVLVDDTVIYETDVYDSRFYNSSPGNLWNVLNISSKYSGKLLEIRINMVYDANAITVDSLLLGDKADIIMDFFADNMFGIIISLLLMLLGVVLLVIDLLPSYGRSKKHHGLFWLAIYAFLTGVWSLIETNAVQFCVDDMRILQLVDNMIMMVDTLPLLLYLDSEYQMLKNKGMRFFAYLGIVYMFLCIGLQYSGKKDFHHMLNNGLYLMLVTDVAMIIWLICRAVKLAKEKLPVLNCLLLVIGLTLNCSSSIFETIRSLQQDRMDRAGVIRIGMLALCICFAIGSQVETYKIVVQGLKYDLISQLAYSDGLTGLGNRTAYLEQLESYENSQKENLQLGIVYLDVNNLKLVNDKQGHEYGDEFIKGAAQIIESSFGTFGKAYRIGGDEFCVLMTGTNLKEKYGKGLDIFKQLIDEANKANRYSFKLQIAHGFAVCNEITKDKIEEAIAIADSEMYQNKTKLKRGA